MFMQIENLDKPNVTIIEWNLSMQLIAFRLLDTGYSDNDKEHTIIDISILVINNSKVGRHIDQKAN